MATGKDDIRLRIEEELEVAKRRLDAARLLYEKDMEEDAVNRAYYSFFHAAKAMLNVLGFDAKTHSGLLSEFGLRIVKNNLIGKEYGAYFRKAFELRESSDYELGVVFGKNEVRDLIDHTEAFLKVAQKFVNEKL